MPDSTERLGELLLRMGALKPHEISVVLNYQKKHPNMLFGQIALGLGYITMEELEKYL